MRFVIFNILFCICSTVMMAQGSIAKPKAEEIGFARHYVEDYLASRGVNIDGISFSLEEYTEHLFFFDDMFSNAFILVAREQYAELLNDRVLAFSIGVPHSKACESETFMHLFQYYDKLISEIHKGELPKEEKQDVPPLRINPMLYTIRWTQLMLDGELVGQKDNVLYGCGPVAIGQLMKYYRWPTKTAGTINYTDNAKNTRSMNLNGIVIEWDKIPDHIVKRGKKIKELDHLMEIVGKAVNANYGNKATSSSSRMFKKALTENFGFSSRMFLVDKMNVDESTIIKLIRKELTEGRPCILTGGHHVFVCDGAYEDFLHLNMGWGGSYDGWYRFPVVRTATNKNSFFDTALLNIVPGEDSKKEKKVTVDEPGKLSALLTEEECANVTSLKVTGKLNGADIRLLRRMAGSIESCDLFSWKGILSTLDITDAEIVDDTIPYVCENTQFFRLCKKTSLNVVGYGMFGACENLKHIYMPKNTIKIGPYAISDVPMLREITVPSLSNVAVTSFYRCASLERVSVCPDSPVLKLREKVDANVPLFIDCSPYLKIEIDSTLESHASARAKYMEQDVGEEPKYIKRNKNVPIKDGPNYPLGTKVISRYKIVNGKKKLISRKMVPADE